MRKQSRSSLILSRISYREILEFSFRIHDPSTRNRVLLSVEVAVPPARAFEALASPEVTRWWVRPGVFDTREWAGDVRVGGRWRASGLFRGQPYSVEGAFLEVDAPRWLAHTWHGVRAPGAATTVTYVLEASGRGTRIELRHSGFDSREASAGFSAGWEASFERLVEILA